MVPVCQFRGHGSNTPMNLEPLYHRLLGTSARRWVDQLPGQIAEATDPQTHGRLSEWQDALNRLPNIKAAHLDLCQAAIEVGQPSEVDEQTRQSIEAVMRDLMPWRKGPFNVFGTLIDTEWRSDWKWDRIAPHISDLKDRWVLDVGCGSGYHCWRMSGEAASQVVGIDPTLLFYQQFAAVKHFTDGLTVDMLPLPLEALPENLCLFDTTFSMGVLYHRRSPIEHLLQLRDSLKPGGELILETLVVEGPTGYSLVPEDRYARMRNVWFLPSLGTLEHWMKRCQFDDIRIVDCSTTTT
ncbi:unnamed protein product, partial [Cyprideis torosa]